MHLDHRHRDRLHRVVQRDRGVGEAAGVEHHRLGAAAHWPRAASRSDGPRGSTGACRSPARAPRARSSQPAGDIVERVGPVDLRLAQPSRLRLGPLRTKIEIGGVAIARSLYDARSRQAQRQGSFMVRDGTISIRGQWRAPPASIAGDQRRRSGARAGLEPTKVAVERNLEVVPRSTLGRGDRRGRRRARDRHFRRRRRS